MVKQSTPSKTNHEKIVRRKPEFLLVIIMLITLTIIVGFILLLPVDITSRERDSGEILKTVLDYRKDILSIVLTAFGAWVGAGAAYFFGKENLKESADSLLALHRQSTGIDKLKGITIREITPRSIEKVFKADDTIKDVLTFFSQSNNNWFIVIESKGKYIIIQEEGFYHFIHKEFKDGIKYGETEKKHISDVNQFLISKPKLKHYTDFYITTNMGNTIAEVNNELQDLGLHLAIVVDAKGIPAYYCTTNDIRKVLLKM